MTINIIFLFLILCSSLLTIYSKYVYSKSLLYAVKPLTMIFIIAFGYYSSSYSTNYSQLIFIALVLSLIGDVCLMFPEKYFNQGLLSFLLAHLVFAYAFLSKVLIHNYFWFIPVFIFAITVYVFLQKNLGKMKYPVLGYLVVISIMFWSAINNFEFSIAGQNYFLLFGAILFVISDTVLAFNKFNKQFKSAEAIILSTYFIAQTFFVLSI